MRGGRGGGRESKGESANENSLSFGFVETISLVKQNSEALEFKEETPRGGANISMSSCSTLPSSRHFQVERLGKRST